jgi:hypothetical protein
VVAEFDQRIDGQLGHDVRVAFHPAPGDEDRRGQALALEDVEHLAIERVMVTARGARVEGQRDRRFVGGDVSNGKQRSRAAKSRVRRG